MNRIVVSLAVVLLLATCSPNNVTVDNSIEKYFTENKVTGTFGMFDNGKGKFTIYNVPRFRDSVYMPGSTFGIVNAMIGLETGRVKDDSVVIPWDGIPRVYDAWNRDLKMFEAFRVSSVPWFQELARRIGSDTMQHWLDTLGYGSRYGKPVITPENLEFFWLDSSLKISADEQLGLVKKMYFRQLPFQDRTQRLVNGMMLMENNANYELSYKTGSVHTFKSHVIGWITGWVEENNHPYFFVLQLESTDPDYNMTTSLLTILKSILRQYGFFEGKR